MAVVKNKLEPAPGPLMFARCIYGHRRVISARGMRKVVARAIDGQPRAKSAEQLGIHEQYLYAILNGKKGVGDDLARRLGFERIVAFRRLAVGGEHAAEAGDGKSSKAAPNGKSR